MPSISTRVGEISYSVHGTGPPIVLLHATLHSSHDFDSVISQLSQHCQTIAIDWPWHGDSPCPSEQLPTAALFADVLEDIVTGLHLPPAIFIGNSVGGFAAARLAIRLPEHVKGLVLVGTGGFVPWTWFLKLFTRLLGIEWVTKLIFPSLVRRYMSPQNTGDRLITTRVSELAKTVEGSKIAASLFRSFLDPSYDLRSVASEIKAPTLIVWGKRDLAVPLNIGHATHKAIESSRFEVLDAGHVVFASKPAEFLTVAESFIQECFTVNASTEM